MSKHGLRSEILAKRNSLSFRQVNLMSNKIAKNLFSMQQIDEAKTIMLYSSFVNEPMTKPIIDKLLSMGKKVALPLTISSTRELIPLLVNESSECRPNKIGIPEPLPGECEKIDEKKIDVVIVPGIAFDHSGHRIGFGFGYYDRFLKKLRPDTIKIALAFDFQIVNNAHAKPHDVPVDFIVTEKRILECRKAVNV